MEGDILLPSQSYNTPAYDLATGEYINQPPNQVECWTKDGGYTTCYNTQFGIQLRKGQPPPAYKNKKKKKVKKVVNSWDKFDFNDGVPYLYVKGKGSAYRDMIYNKFYPDG